MADRQDEEPLDFSDDFEILLETGNYTEAERQEFERMIYDIVKFFLFL